MDKFKDITIGDRTFRIGRMNALNGNFVANSLQAARTNEDVFRRCQAYCFDACSVYKSVPATGENIPMKIFDLPGTWRDKDLADDFDTVNQLYEAVIEFNFSLFFARFFAKLEAAQAKLAEETPDTGQPNSPQS